MKQTQTLSALFSFPGFRARSRLHGIFGDPHARLVTLVRRKKPPCARTAGRGTGPFTTAGHAECGIPMPQAGASSWHMSNGG
jgi:hypothetical protein